jgi:hypothetical protein
VVHFLVNAMLRQQATISLPVLVQALQVRLGLCWLLLIQAR